MKQAEIVPRETLRRLQSGIRLPFLSEVRDELENLRPTLLIGRMVL